MNSGPIVLSLETATLGGSVYLGRGAIQLASRLGDPKVSHSNSLLIDIAGVLEEGALTLQDVELLACASGPGSFTGLRIGIATLKALAATLQKPVVGIPTLQAVAHAAGPSEVTVALLPAGRGELFSQMFTFSDDGKVTSSDQPAHVSPERLIARYGKLENVLWAGSGAHAQVEFLNKEAQERGLEFHGLVDPMGQEGSGWKIAAPITNLARNVAALAIPLYQAGEVDSPHTLSALYVRPSDAELNKQCL